MTSSQYGPYGQGCTRTTMPGTKGSKTVKWSQSHSFEWSDLGSPVFTPDPWFLLRKEVIQPQVPLRLPCYDFIPITSHTFGTF